MAPVDALSWARTAIKRLPKADISRRQPSRSRDDHSRRSRSSLFSGGHFRGRHFRGHFRGQAFSGTGRCEKLSVLAVRRKSGMVLARRPDQHEGRYRVWMLSAPRDIELLGACCGLRAAERSSPVSDQAAASAAALSLRRMLSQRIML
jgi:hypothetical protein